MIESSPQLELLLQELRQSNRIAIDTEADSLHSYPGRLCLVQLAFDQKIELVDTLADIKIEVLMAVLKQKPLIFHAADYDLRLLYLECEFMPEEIFDTMLAAKLLGKTEIGLAALSKSCLGVDLPKTSQKADWGKRPLTDRMDEYARNDVRYLFELADNLKDQLVAKQRLSWHEEWCRKFVKDACDIEPSDPDKVWRLKGSNALDRRGLAILREIWHWRENEALTAGKPPYFVLSHQNAIEIARCETQGIPSTVTLKRMSTRRKAGLNEAIDRAFAIPDAELPDKLRNRGKRLTDRQLKAMSDYQNKRDKAAEELAIDPTIIASKGTLLELIRNPEKGIPKLMSWQKTCLGI